MTEEVGEEAELSQQMDDVQLNNTDPIAIKVLVSNLGVGAIIGRSGASITEIQQGSGTKVQISGPADVFPGTTERIMLISGEMLKVMSALHMVMQKWKSESVFRDNADMDPEHVQLRMVILGKLCGAVIGEAGKNIKQIMHATSTDIRVQNRGECMPRVQERVITIVGGENFVLQAVGRILRKVLADPAFEEYQQQTLSHNGAGVLGYAGIQRPRLHPDEPLAQVPCTFVMQLGQSQAGAVLGMKGANIISINKMSGAKVSIQGRGDVAEGDLRALTISGTYDGVVVALDMVSAALREQGRQSRFGQGRGGGRSHGHGQYTSEVS